MPTDPLDTSSPGGSETDRTEKLLKAERLLNEAADLMDDALHMSGMEQRSGNDSQTIRRIASDREYAGSLHNLARDLSYMDEEQPNWTQPLTSPKKQFDIKGKDSGNDKL